MARTVVALYDDLSDAHEAVQELQDHGFYMQDISVMGYDPNGQYGQYINTQGEQAAPPTERGADAATGAGIGALIGGIGGLLVGLGALVIPGIGPVVAAGSLATALVGAGVGAAAGGLIGALVDAGIPEEEAGYYAEGVRRGGTLLVLHSPDARVEEAVEIMEAHNPVDVEERATQWQDEGWSEFNPEGEPYAATSASQMDRPYTGTNAPSYATEGELPMNQDENMDRPATRRSYSEDIVQPSTRGTQDTADTTENQLGASGMGTGRSSGESFTAPGVIGGTSSTIGQGSMQRSSEPEIGRRSGMGASSRQTQGQQGYMAPGSSQDTQASEKSGSQAPGKWGNAGVSGKRQEEPPEQSDTVGVTNRQEYTTKGSNTTAGSEREGYKPEGIGRQRVTDDKMHATEGPEADSIKGPQGKGYTQSGLSSDRAVEGPDMEYEQGFRSHYEMTYKPSGRPYESYQPAYRYGYGLANDPRYSGRNWDDIEMAIQRDWEEEHQNEGAWDDVKDAIRKGWNSIRRTLT